MTTDALLERITAPVPDEVRAKFVTVPFPKALAPKLVHVDRDPTGKLPSVDAVLCCWTAAEKQAVCDVFGVPEAEWDFYSRDFDSYLPELTSRSPAKDVRRLAEFAVVMIGPLRVLLLHSQLHMCTDSTSIPLIRFVVQVVADTGAATWIDTGTSGGIGSAVLVGDTVIATRAVADFTGFLKGNALASASIAATYDVNSLDYSQALALMATNAHLLPPSNTRAPKVFTGRDVASCDGFYFDMQGDPFHLETLDDGNLLAEEMDLVAVASAIVSIENGPKWCSLRSVSDPQMPGGSVPAEKKAASEEYDEYGFGAQVATNIADWQVLAGLAS